MTTPSSYDVVVVGAGPAGSAAALAAKRCGASVLLIERGPFPGSKNVYGGVVYPRILGEIIPKWKESVPVERWITRRSTMIMSENSSLTVAVDSEKWNKETPNGITTLRSNFDRWLAQNAVAGGVDLVCSTLATGLICQNGSDKPSTANRVIGVRTDRGDGDVLAKVVILADGVNSLLAKSAGMYPNFAIDHLTLGVKEVLYLGRERIEERFCLEGDDGCDLEIMGCTDDIAGGGFLYTNQDTVSLGVVLSIGDLATHHTRPEMLIDRLKSHPSLAGLLKGGTLKEYSAHMIPEVVIGNWPQLSLPGVLVAGDAAGSCLASGLWLEGVNMAIGSGIAAGRFAANAAKDLESTKWSGYDQSIKESSVGKNHRRFQRAPELVMSDSLQRIYPKLANNIASSIFTVTDPIAKKGVLQTVRSIMADSDISATKLALDALKIWRAFR